MRDTDRVLTISVPLWDNATREAVRQFKALTQNSPRTFSSIVCEAIREKAEKLKND